MLAAHIKRKRNREFGNGLRPPIRWAYYMPKELPAQVYFGAEARLGMLLQRRVIVRNRNSKLAADFFVIAFCKIL